MMWRPCGAFARSPVERTPVILVENRGLPFVNLYCNFQMGPAFDPPGRAGLTSLTNRMLARGTKQRGRAALEEAIEILGTELVTSTQRDAVSVGGSVLTRNLEKFLGILTEVLTESTFDADELEKVKREVCAELLSDRDDDGTLAAIWFRRLTFAGHAFGHGGQGTIPGVSAITREDVLAQAARMYTRDNMLVGASGDADVETLERLLAPLSALPTGRPDWTFPAITPPVGRHIALIDKPDRTQAQIIVGHPSFQASDPDYHAVEIATTAFGGTFTSRLMEEVRVKRGWSYGAHARIAVERANGYFLMSAAPALGYAPETVGLLLSEYEKFVNEGLSDEEIDFARGYILKTYPFRVETAGLRSAQLVQSRLLGRPDDYVARYCERLAALSHDAIRDAVRRRLDPANLRVIIVGTAAEGDFQSKLEQLPGVTALTVIPHDQELT